jgi:UDP-glucose:(heptosyl)LPS alpha-1,3-glucosyltransferase
MRIALVTESVDNETGIGRIVYALSQQFVQRGHDIYLVAHNISVANHASHVYRITRPTPWHSVNRFMLRYSVPRVLRTLGCDVVNSYLVGRGATVITAQSCHAAGVSLRVQDPEIRPRGNAGLFDRIAVQDEKALFRSSDTRRIIAVSRLVKHQICEYYKVDEEKIVVIPNGVDLERFAGLRNAEKPQALRYKMGLHEDERVLLFVGNEFARKGLHVVIKAMSRLRGYPMRLVVLGGDDPAPFVRLASRFGLASKIEFRGSVSGPEEYFCIADAFVFPTYYEPFGLVIIEAMAAGVPVITSKYAGAVEGMHHGVDGLFLDNPASEEELAATLQQLLDNPGLSDTLTRNATNRVRAFSWDLIAEKTLDVYRAAIAK